ncbi:MAG TPA: hypothetical protein VJH96_01000 [Patescibacteria group bacterium]|nr:hypothetical protein [Patescibacteria group bacterium]
MKKKKQEKILFFVFIILVIIIISLFFLLYSPQSNTYSFNDFKFTLNIPTSYQIEEQFTSVILKNPKGEIIIDKINTNYENIQDYLTNLEKKNKIVITNQKTLVINNINSLIAFIEHPISRLPREKAYFYYPTNWTIYSLSTSSEVLFDDLDRIARSFRYTP